MFRNLEAEQRRLGFTNAQMAEKLGIARLTYESKKKNGNFNRTQITTMLNLFNCDFFYLFECDEQDKAS
ncbi:hypothetical protein CLNEO_05140 [Anaerotignum neopropionicum]|uniref:HTH cro/C1-type domain-containing protein n=1 Tax=Anaerotignum neopropionicum TaxID=36847 RepID=A0A136WIL4_9FIRM|nr:hypothetical protein [Anaerotignum neopropionicum]KXL54408.1 hypothetical protein CLNEO_05140 [Anaerotignum neopropionicum]